jgi:hypothetical protein
MELFLSSTFFPLFAVLEELVDVDPTVGIEN